jgi:hypothetical protein
VIAELRNPQTLGGQRYDALVITERHDLPLAWEQEDTVRYLRHYHERMIEGNAQAKSYLYHSWWGINDKNDPASWVAYERSAAPVWQCVATRINTSLRNEGRSDRMTYLPAGLALAELVDRATRGYVPGVTGGNSVDTLNKLFRDNVHMSDMGMYYMGLVTYASVFRTAPTGNWVPAGIPADAARSLQEIAWSVVSNHFATATEPTLESCQAYMRNTFCTNWGNYLRISQATPTCIRYYSTSDTRNPFYFSPATEPGFWLPAP